MPPDRTVVALAARRHAIVMAAQLEAAGLTRHAVAHRLGIGWLRRIHRGVYLVGPLAAPNSRAMAATVACGDDALLSHRWAAALWDLIPAQAIPIDVTVPGRKARTRPGLRVHRDRVLPEDASRRDGIPVTSPARTLLDLATTAEPNELARATEEAHILHLVTHRSLTEQFRRYPHHPGVAPLTRATPAEPSLTRSEAERRLLELIRAAGLPQPRTNARVAGHEVDFLWPAERLVVEVDGFAYHGTRAAFERDRRRDADLQAAGLRVLRVTWRRIDEDRRRWSLSSSAP